MTDPSDWNRICGDTPMPTVSGPTAIIQVRTPDGLVHTFDGHGTLTSTGPRREPGPNDYIDRQGSLRSRTRCQCSHHIDIHDKTGRCQGGDDDGDGYFDQCYCTGFEPRLLGV